MFNIKTNNYISIVTNKNLDMQLYWLVKALIEEHFV
jgi:hypothetical protein